MKTVMKFRINAAGHTIDGKEVSANEFWATLKRLV